MTNTFNHPDASADAPDPTADVFGFDALAGDLCDVQADTPDPSTDVAGEDELPTFQEVCADVCDPRPDNPPKPLARGSTLTRLLAPRRGER